MSDSASATARIPSGRKSLAASSERIALGPLDGRYSGAVAPLVDYLSEAALNRDRVGVEVEWFIHLTNNVVLPGTEPLTAQQQEGLRAIVTEFDAAAVQELADIEKVTVHDVKAVEYFIGNRLPALGLEHLKPLVHFGCTSEDINNLSYAVGVKGAVEDVWLPAARALVAKIAAMAEENRAVPMLSRTHGQPATPTTLGKELAVTAFRLTRQLDRIAKTEFLGKINGATGTYSAHYASVPSADWEDVAKGFVESLGLTWN
ncbi:MAG: lyase family protein, partial [Specibacter sp.]